MNDCCNPSTDYRGFLYRDANVHSSGTGTYSGEISETNFKSKTHKRHKKHKKRPSKPVVYNSGESNGHFYGGGDEAVVSKAEQFEDGGLTDNGSKDTREIEEGELPDFSWLTKEFKFIDVGNDVDQVNELNPSFPENHQQSTSLSQTKSSFPTATAYNKVMSCDRESIEEEIKRKYAELDELMDQINATKKIRRRHRKYQLRKYDHKKYTDGDEWVPSYVNIYPIKRRKRSAQPIRNAVLIRSAMKKTWKGMLGSCCGKGCWATWHWINLGNVISDYE